MSQEQAPDPRQEPAPVCPQCGSEDTAPLPQEPVPAGAPPGVKVKEQRWYRCLTCRYKWKEGTRL
jgi:uncharacterized protein with PIN domain